MSRTTRRLAPAALVAGVLLACVLALSSPRVLSAVPAEKEKPHALLVVGVFTAEGFALPRIAVSVKRKEDRKPKWCGQTDRRAELGLRLPAGRGTYEVSTESKEYANQTQTLEVSAEERVDVIFRLNAKKGAEKEP